MIAITDLAAVFENRYGRIARFFGAPGRINLIGEHTDYNGGYVLPMAIGRGTLVAIAPRTDRILRVWSLNLDESIELNLDLIGSGRHGDWRDYVEGVASALLDKGILLTGADIALESDLAIGGGLSSSAALEISLGMAMAAVSNCAVDKRTLAFAGQTAEHRYVGINSGIMDQFTSVFGLENHAILLDCRSLEVKNIPIHLDEYQLVVCDSRVRHALASSEYNQRRRDCEMGVKLLSCAFPHIDSLRDFTLSDLADNKHLLPPKIFRRCRHVVSENDRTLKTAEALAAGNAAEVGRLMSASHLSLRYDYEVSCPELDLLVEIAVSLPGVLGARMTGGGFGGCTVNLVEKRSIESFRTKVALTYEAQTHLIPDIFAAEASNGAREVFAAANSLP
jgi:galactokinase